MSKNRFHRYEYKYLITPTKYLNIIEDIKNHLSEDKYGRTTIQSLYYDTPNYSLIRASIEKPNFKEKIRIRGYGKIGENDLVFIEMKRKCDKLVYKRRVRTTNMFATEFMNYSNINEDSQIYKELKYFIEFYRELKPAVLLLYDREAYCDDSDLRVTFDTNIRYRFDDLKLGDNLKGNKLRDDDLILMEIKSSCKIPLWLVTLLSENDIFKTSFSKYGTVYQKYIFKEK